MARIGPLARFLAELESDMYRESQITHENGAYWVLEKAKGSFEVYRNVGTHSVRCAIISFRDRPDYARDRAVAECQPAGQRMNVADIYRDIELRDLGYDPVDGFWQFQNPANAFRQRDVRDGKAVVFQIGSNIWGVYSKPESV